MLAGYDLSTDRLYGHVKTRKGRVEFPAFIRCLRSPHPPQVRIGVVLDNFGPHPVDHNRPGSASGPRRTTSSWELRRRLDGLLVVSDGSRWSELDRLRRAPARASGPGMVRALDRAAEVAGLGAGRVAVGEIPPAQLEGLARQGLTANAAMLRRLPEAPCTATLLATTPGAAGDRGR